MTPEKDEVGQFAFPLVRQSAGCNPHPDSGPADRGLRWSRNSNALPDGCTRYAGSPEFRTGFTNHGNTPTWSPSWRDERTVSYSANLTKLAGSHDLKGGYRGDYLFLDNWQPERAFTR